jgi:hypothetical protein
MPFLKKKPPLFNFAYHRPGWLQEIAKRAEEEPWGPSLKVLELYLRCNFEIAKAQDKVHEDKDKGVAFFRAGRLVSKTADPLWLLYERQKGDQEWVLKDVPIGDVPVLGQDRAAYELIYTPPSFDMNWTLYFPDGNVNHILQHNHARLEHAFRGVFQGAKLNEHIALRTVLAEIELKRKAQMVIPQWYMGDYQFLMPLHLTQATKVDLTAALSPEPALRRYRARTLLLPTFAYAYARAVVNGRAAFADWMMLSEAELESTSADEDEEGDQAK